MAEISRNQRGTETVISVHRIKKRTEDAAWRISSVNNDNCGCNANHPYCMWPVP